MTEEELDRLARLIAAEIARGLDAAAPSRRGTAPWVPSPVRPEPSERTHTPAPWTGAGQSLGDIAPSPSPVRSGHRVDDGEHAAVVRAAAAGRPVGGRSSRAVAGVAPATAPTTARRGAGRLAGVSVPIGVSNRHLHLSAAHALVLFGQETLTVDRTISQPGQFAAIERVSVIGPGGKLTGVRVVGPARGETQLELSSSDARHLGVAPPVVASGQLDRSLGGLRLEGPKGFVDLARGVIIPSRHLHCSPADARRLGLADGDMLSVRCGAPGRAATLHAVLVRSGPGHATELHLDADEAAALGVATGDAALLAQREPAAGASRRTLITEGDVLRIVRAGGTLPDGALLTPSAKDRARALGLTA
jgi:putative phosphotransacetylase